MHDARTITLALRGRWYGGYGLCFCPAHENTRTPALGLADGDDGRLLAHCFNGCAFGDVAARLRARGLLDGRGVAPDPLAAAKRHADDAQRRAERIATARSAWAKGEPIAGTLAERYLRGRAIRGPLPPSLRFHAAAYHGPTKRRLPAMLAAATLADARDVVAVHRTFLAEPGRKADLDGGAKLSLGPVGGAAVRLTNGAGPLVVAEGIETALSLADDLAGLDPSVWAGLSAAGVAKLRLPTRAAELICAPDGDRAGRDAAHSLAERATALGWRVRILPAPGDGLDWNDAARGKVTP